MESIYLDNHQIQLIGKMCSFSTLSCDAILVQMAYPYFGDGKLYTSQQSLEF